MFRKAILLTLLFFSIFAPSTQATNMEIPAILHLKGYWFLDGFLADDPRYMDWEIIPQQTILLYKDPDNTSEIARKLITNSKAWVRNILYEASPGTHIIFAPQAMATGDGSLTIPTGEPIGLIGYQGSDGMAAYVQGQIVLLDVISLKLYETIPAQWRNNLSGTGQWLQLQTNNGEIGWARFYNEKDQHSNGRWQIQPNAVGSSSNFNAIIFSNKMPHFQFLPLLDIKQ